jgi:hypothetical protein
LRRDFATLSAFYFSSVHYDYARHYGYGRSHYGVVEPYHHLPLAVPVRPVHVHPAPVYAHGYGYQVPNVDFV